MVDGPVGIRFLHVIGFYPLSVKGYLSFNLNGSLDLYEPVLDSFVVGYPHNMVVSIMRKYSFATAIFAGYK